MRRNDHVAQRFVTAARGGARHCVQVLRNYAVLQDSRIVEFGYKRIVLAVREVQRLRRRQQLRAVCEEDFS